ncbi:phosphate signaling complex protein PhoU [Symbiobacterium thermophilum]|uniref:Phosphate-specific transport system accessory protein PhoU n=1 Tax=Symbiobacterium thermophilum (strain DSM 24528 / JCM 14929 / IAM 14863 / T) TaxID=292459 RepID=Q67LI3_SYMTH|nr:phosphate signaling complex protein PhoU [Symbiobacterium thermophilum]BAD41463.1 PhoU-family transcriptional regulator [Symbiobacterium thermophilum IAM 14863]
MRSALETQLRDLNRDVLQMGRLVSGMVEKAVRSLAQQDAALAQQVIDQDDEVDRMLIAIEMRCLQVMALQQPMARDLRAVGSSLKVVTDLERVADHATDIAEVTLKLAGEPLIKPLIDIPRMADLAQQMVREALEAFVQQDEAAARTMIARDHDMDDLYRAVFDELVEMMERDPGVVRQATYLLHVAGWLERIGDHATNLGEWIIYQLTGELNDLNT